MTHVCCTKFLKFLCVFVVWLLIAVLCFFFMPLTAWANLAPKGLITVLALVVTAILLRAMRSFPVVDPNSFENEMEIDEMENQYLRATKAVVLAGCVAGGMLIFMLIIVVAKESLINTSALWYKLDEVLSAVIGVLTIFLAWRIYYFVQLDLDIIRVQAKAVRKKFKKKQKKQEFLRNQNDDFEHSFEDTGEYPGKKNVV